MVLTFSHLAFATLYALLSDIGSVIKYLDNSQIAVSAYVLPFSVDFSGPIVSTIRVSNDLCGIAVNLIGFRVCDWTLFSLHTTQFFFIFFICFDLFFRVYLELVLLAKNSTCIDFFKLYILFLYSSNFCEY